MTTQQETTDTYPGWVRDSSTRDYFEKEWGKVPLSEETIFEQLCLMTFQLGLTFTTVLSRRQALYNLLGGYSLEKVAALEDEVLEQATQNPAIIRNFYKLKACRDNARALIEHDIDLADLFLNAFCQPITVDTVEDLPRTHEASDDICRSLRLAGLRYIGPVGVCSVAQALGLIQVRSATVGANS